MVDLRIILLNVDDFRIGIEGKVEYFDAIIGQPAEIVY